MAALGMVAEEERGAVADKAAANDPDLTLIHRSDWKGNFTNFATASNAQVTALLASAFALASLAPAAFAVSGNSPKSPGNSTHFKKTETPCTVGGGGGQCSGG